MKGQEGISGHEDNFFGCSMCRQPFSVIRNLEIHVRKELNQKPFTCTICSMEFFTASQYASHGPKQHPEQHSRYQCRECEYESENFDEVQEHEGLHIPGFKLYDCSKCGNSFPTFSELLGHKRIRCGNTPYSCEICAARYKRSEDLNIHRRSHNNLPVYECFSCSKLFANIKNYAVHILKKHNHLLNPEETIFVNIGAENGDMSSFLQTLSNRNCSRIGPSVGNNISIVENDERILTDMTNEIMNKYGLVKNLNCKLCSMAFVREKSLNIHCVRVHKIESEKITLNQRSSLLQYCEICGESCTDQTGWQRHMLEKHNGLRPYSCKTCKLQFVRPSSLTDHVKLHYEEQYKCKYCKKSFFTQSSLAVHHKKHEGQNSVQCTVCNIPYSNEKLLTRHMRIHSNGKPHKCDFCNMHFAQSCDKQKHMRKHTGERPYFCEICEKSFSYIASYKKHKVTHSNEKKFQCSVCGKAFNHKGNYLVHCHGHTGDKLFRCVICEKKFAKAAHLKEHMKIHTQAKDFECTLCHKKFRHRSSLDKHKKSHSGERAYQCSACSKSFLQSAHLKSHMRIHTNEKPYSCEVCEKNFRRSDSLRNHRKIHNKKSEI